MVWAPRRTWVHAAVELAGILALWVLVAAIAARVVLRAEGVAQWGWIAISAAAGYFFADLMSGIMHWAGDTLGDEDMPVIGRAFIRPFREHHEDPTAITRHGFLETNGNNSLISIPMLLGVWLGFPEPETPGLFVLGLSGSTAVFTFGTNQFHKWAHAERVGPVVRALQRWGLILPPERHALHHAPPHDRHYCITTGMCSEFLGRMRFFRALEWMIERVSPGALHREGRPG
jgi:ubiquitin-conjugating enzyme E2 variant